MARNAAPRPPATPDGSPKAGPKERDARDGSLNPEAQDPSIASDRKDDHPRDSYEPVVDESGGVKPRREGVDLLH